MNRTYTLIFISLLFFFNPNKSLAQHIKQLDKDGSVSYAKMYLHTDRESYFRGDSIWFKAYYVNGQSNQFIKGVNNLYVDLVDKKGNIIYNEVLLLDFGVSSGNLKIPLKAKVGNYTLRAYTDLQKSYGEDAFFYKKLQLREIKSSKELLKDRLISDKAKSSKIDVAFLPEGGFLLAGKMNVVGVKAIDEFGMGKLVKGKVVNSKGKTVSSFITEYKGLAKIHFIPVLNESYTVSLENYSKFHYKFKDIRSEGIKVEFASRLKDELMFRVISNSVKFHEREFLLAVMHRGEVISYQKFKHQSGASLLSIKQNDLPGGINRIVLLDKDLQPISERLYFSKNIEVNDVEIISNQNAYRTRTNVQLDLFDVDDFDNNSYSNLSVSVVDESAIQMKGASSNILNYLLLDSELKGFIECPSDYFVDDDNCSSDVKLNNLMLTQAWNKYLWSQYADKEISSDYKNNHGITITGKVKRMLSKKPIVNGDVVLGIFKDDYVKTYVGKTNNYGVFSVDSILFTDTASVFVQARNKKGKLNTRVFLNPIFEQGPKISGLYLPTERLNKEGSLKLYRQKYFSDLAMKKFNPEAGSVLLDEITIRARKIEKKIKHFKIHGRVHHRYDLNDTERKAYINVFSFLRTVPGVNVAPGNIVSLRGISRLIMDSAGGGQPLYLLDGFKVIKEDVESVFMDNVDVIEVLKTPSETAIYGAQGFNGVIAIYTKIFENKVDPILKGGITEKIVGYSSYREFYSPKYTSKNIHSKKPDNRLTLYWNPNVLTQNGQASVSFFTSDDISNFRVYVEGITNTGKICIGTAEFTVNEYRSTLNKE